MKAAPAYIRGSVAKSVQAAVNLWLWSHVVEAKSLPEHPSVCWVYPSHLSNGGPTLLNGKRVRVTLVVEDDE
jgi:hypothetical protein